MRSHGRSCNYPLYISGAHLIFVVDLVILFKTEIIELDQPIFKCHRIHLLKAKALPRNCDCFD